MKNLLSCLPIKFPYTHPPTLDFLANKLTSLLLHNNNSPFWLSLLYSSEITNKWPLVFPECYRILGIFFVVLFFFF